MGCNSSVETDPNVMYSKDLPFNEKQKKVLFHEDEKTKPVRNGSTRRRSSAVAPQNQNHNQMKGDITLFNEAKMRRRQTLHKLQKRRESRAQAVSEKAMDEKEMLSLVSSRSRGTSRATSPRARHRQSMDVASETPTDVTYVRSADSRVSSSLLERDTPPGGESVQNHKEAERTPSGEDHAPPAGEGEQKMTSNKVTEDTTPSGEDKENTAPPGAGDSADKAVTSSPHGQGDSVTATQDGIPVVDN